MPFLAHPIFFKNVLEVFRFYNLEWCFPLLKGEKNELRIFSDFVIRKSQKIGRVT